MCRATTKTGYKSMILVNYGKVQNGPQKSSPPSVLHLNHYVTSGIPPPD
jgi:hypothetical protein